MKKKHTQGFTILELIVTVAIAGILVAVGLPNMQNFIKNERRTAYTNSLLSDLMLARSKAVERNQPVIICSSSNEATCTSSNYENGWIVAVDSDNDGTITGLDEIIKIQQAISGEISYNLSDPGLDIITFDNRGFTPNNQGTFSICDDRGADHARSLSLSPTGRVSRGDINTGVTPVC